METLIRGGKIINSDGSFFADILIRNGVIAQIRPVDAGSADTGAGMTDIGTSDAQMAGNGAASAFGENSDFRTVDRVIDADGLFVLPGAIDAHTHLEMKMGKTFSADGYESGTRAAACGGVTTVFDYTLQENGRSMLDEIKERDLLAAPAACVDYAFHGGISEVDDMHLAEIAEMVEQGFTSIKAYMTYDFGLGDADLYRLLQAAGKAQALITVHAESDAIVSVNRSRIIEDGPKKVWYHYLSRPEIAEEEADIRAIKLAEAAGAPIYIVHLANAGGEKFIEEYRREAQSAGLTETVDIARRGNHIRVFAETCPHYLEFTNEVYKRPYGIRYICSPPMKGEESRQALWNGIRDGVIDTIATDHCPAQTFEKDWGKDDFTLAPNGCMGIENMYPYMLDAAGKGKITYEKAVELCSNNPARIFGCDKKGKIAVGNDADIVLYDPSKQFTISKDTMHSDLDYTIYEGKVLKGYPVMTISRGMVVYEDGEFKGRAGYGRLVRRKPSCAYRPL